MMLWSSTAEKNDIPWRAMTKEILESDVYKEMESIQNRSIVYPACNSTNFFVSYLSVISYMHVLLYLFNN